MSRRIDLALLASALLGCATETGSNEAEADDAAPIYRSLNGRFPALPKAVEEFLGDRPVDPAELRTALDPYAPLLEELARATRARRCDWTYPSPPSLTMDFPLDYVLIAARILSVRAKFRQTGGDLPAAWSDLVVLTKFGSDLQQNRSTIGRLLGLICTVLGCDVLDDSIRDGTLDGPALERMRAHLTFLLRRFPTMETVLRDERNAAISLIDEVTDSGFSAVLRRVSQGEVDVKDRPWVVERWENRFREIVRKDRERSKQIMVGRWDQHLGRLSPYTRGPLNSRPKTFDKEEVISKETYQRMGLEALGLGTDDVSLTDAADVLFLLWVPALIKLPQNLALAGLGAELPRLGCLLELHRMKTGAYPPSLEDIGEKTEDPFVGGALQYRRVETPEGQGYVLAAAGPKSDHEIRIRVLVEECRFDKGLFEKKGYDASDDLTFWAFRRR